MKKDIFIDATLASKFVSTKDPLLIELINWLDDNTQKGDDIHYLLATDYIRKEYYDGNQNCSQYYCMGMIYSRLQQQERLNLKTKKEIEAFQKKYFTKKIWNKHLTCKTNCKGEKSNDPEHIASILMSDRKIAIIEEDAFRTDLVTFPVLGEEVTAVDCPSKVNYK